MWSLLIRQSSAFQSTRPVGVETWTAEEQAEAQRHFNPLDPWGSRQLFYVKLSQKLLISIHSTRGGRDLFNMPLCWECMIFQSTRPVGVETADMPETVYHVRISIHSTRGGRDVARADQYNTDYAISIHSTRGGRDVRFHGLGR